MNCKRLICTLLILTSSVIVSAQAITPDEATTRLKDGNGRFVAGESTHTRINSARLLETTSGGQHPFATIIACSDSRVPVETVFDQGVGDLFVVRVAGNVCDTDEVGSIEYGVDHLATPVFVVLGHRNCGAVTAVVTGAELHGSIPALVDNIIPAAHRAKSKGAGMEHNDLIALAVKENVWQSIDDLFKRSPVSRERVKNGKLKVIGAIYDIETGKVEWLGEHPEQSRLLAYESDATHGAEVHGH